MGRFYACQVIDPHRPARGASVAFGTVWQRKAAWGPAKVPQPPGHSIAKATTSINQAVGTFAAPEALVAIFFTLAMLSWLRLRAPRRNFRVSIRRVLERNDPGSRLIQFEQKLKNFIISQWPPATVGRRDSLIKLAVSVLKPSWAFVVEVSERPRLEPTGSSIILGYNSIGIPGDNVMQPTHKFRRVQPGHAQLVQTDGGFGNAHSMWKFRILPRWAIWGEVFRKRKGFERRGRRVTRSILKAAALPKGPQLMEFGTQDAECHVILSHDDLQVLIRRQHAAGKPTEDPMLRDFRSDDLLETAFQAPREETVGLRRGATTALRSCRDYS